MKTVGRFALVAGWIAWAGAATAQQAPAEGGARTAGKAGVKVSWLAARGFGDDGKSVAKVGEEWQSKPFAIPSNSLSEPLALPARKFTLVVKERPVTTIALPEEGKDFVVVLAPNTEGKWQSFAIRTDDGVFRPGDVFIHNSTATMVGGKLGRQEFALPGGKGERIRPLADPDKPFIDVAMYYKQGEQTRILSTTRWPLDERTRGYVFFFTDPKTGRIEYRAVDEFVPPPAAPRGGG